MVRVAKWMLFAAMLAACAVGRPAAAQTANSSLEWQPSIEEAQRAASQSNRLILIHFWSPSCEACKRVEQNVYSQPQVQQQIQAKFVAFKINVDERPTTAKRYGIDRIPMDLLIDSKATIVGRMNCPITPDEYLQKLAATTGSIPAGAPSAQTAIATTEVAPTTQQASGFNTPAWQPPAAAPQANQVAQVTSPAQAPAAVPANVPVQPHVEAQAQVPSRPLVTSQAPTISQPSVAAPPATSIGTVATMPPARQVQPQPEIPAYSNDRYAEFRKRWGDPQTATPSANSATAATAQSPLTPQSAAPSATAVAAVPMAPTITAPPSPSTGAWGTAGYFGSPNPTAGSPGSTLPQQPAAATVARQTTNPAAGAPPLGLDGFCPVTLAEKKTWQAGDRRWGVIHRGRTYLFAGPQEQKLFLDNPDHYSPAVSGQDVVAALDQGQTIEGQRQYGIQYQNRTYLFSSTATRDAFWKNPNRYAAEVLQAENPNRTTTFR